MLDGDSVFGLLQQEDWHCTAALDGYKGHQNRTEVETIERRRMAKQSQV